MKQLIVVIVLIIAFSIFLPNISYAKDLIKRKVIVIDPGHGGKDPGTVYGTIKEKDINLEISLELKKILKKKYIVYMTREGDYDLSKPNAIYRKKSDFDNRISLINDTNSDLYLSIHLNYLQDSRYYGAQVFYDQKNKELATAIQNDFNKNTNSNRKIKEIPKMLYMYKQITIPGVLIECGFLSNKSDRTKLQNKQYQQLISKIIYNSIEKYI